MTTFAFNLASAPAEGTATARRWVRPLLFALTLMAILQSIFGVRMAISPIGRETASGSAQETVQEWLVELEQARVLAEPATVSRLQAAMVESQQLVARQRFPWLILFRRFEAGLRDDVRLQRLAPVQQQPEAGEFERAVSFVLTVASRSRPALAQFHSWLETRPDFSGVFPVRQQQTESGEILLTLELTYTATTQVSE